MTMPASGTITFVDINTEVRVPSGTTRQLNDTCSRTIAGLPTDQSTISMANFYGKRFAGQNAFTTAGSYNYTVPACVNSVCIICVGGGGGGHNGGVGGGGGGALSYSNDIPVTPGEILTVVAGVGGIGETGNNSGNSYVSRNNTYLVLAAGGGLGTSQNAGRGGNNFYGVGDVKYSGGSGGNPSNNNAAIISGGGGAAGYAGDGGRGGWYGTAGANGNGGGGGGGGAAVLYIGWKAGGGGGVGILGQGNSGAGAYNTLTGGGGGGGSGGANGTFRGNNTTPPNPGGWYGGGGGSSGGNGATGAVRIIWGLNRSFPSTDTGNV